MDATGDTAAREMLASDPRSLVALPPMVAGGGTKAILVAFLSGLGRAVAKAGPADAIDRVEASTGAAAPIARPMRVAPEVLPRS